MSTRLIMYNEFLHAKLFPPPSPSSKFLRPRALLKSAGLPAWTLRFVLPWNVFVFSIIILMAQQEHHAKLDPHPVRQHPTLSFPVSQKRFQLLQILQLESNDSALCLSISVADVATVWMEVESHVICCRCSSNSLPCSQCEVYCIKQCWGWFLPPYFFVPGPSKIALIYKCNVF